MVVGDMATGVDVVVLGAGPAGYVSAIRAAQLGKEVVIVEANNVGGVCLNAGCIPSKALLTAADRVWKARTAAEMGITAEVTVDLPQMQQWAQSVVDRLVKGVRQLLVGNGVEIVHGSGWFLDDHEVRIEGEYGAKRYAFEQCIIATGGTPAPHPDLPFDGRRVLTPQAAYRLTELPARVAVVGTDYIAVEVATFFGKLGVPVQLLLPDEKFPLPEFDISVRRHLKSYLKKIGIIIEPNVTDPAAAVADEPLVVVSNGIVPNTADLRLDAVNLSPDENGFIPVNARMQTVNPMIFAVGDVTDAAGMADRAMKQGRVAAAVIAGQAAEYAPQAVPKVVWTEPEIAAVGLTAAEAESAGYAVQTGHFPLAANGRALMLNGGTGFVSVVAEKESDVLLGATIVAPRAAELISEMTLALEMGATLTDVAETLHLHPGLGEPLMESAEDALGTVVHIMHKK